MPAIEGGKILEIREEEPAADARKEDVASMAYIYICSKFKTLQIEVYQLNQLFQRFKLVTDNSIIAF